jgi:hypothetical protein
MRTFLRNLTLSAAALVAALTMAPKSEAAWRGHVGGSIRHSVVFRGAPFRGVRGAPFRGAPFRTVGFRAAPFRTFGGFRFYSYCPGPGYIYVNDGWVLPPFPGAVWIAPHYGRGGVYIRGTFRR